VARLVESVFNVAESAPVVEAIFALHFAEAKVVLDMTFGKGRFWKWEHPFKVVGVDIDPKDERAIKGDSRHTGLPPGQVDVCVIDPPFMHAGLKTTVHGDYNDSSREAYNSTVKLNDDYARLSSQAAVLDLYTALLIEAHRLQADVLVKCKDTIQAGKLVLASHNIARVMEEQNYAVIDKAVMIPTGPLVTDPKWKRQQHFRRRESYFFVGRWLF
jgi:hypothetical protein